MNNDFRIKLSPRLRAALDEFDSKRTPTMRKARFGGAFEEFAGITSGARAFKVLCELADRIEGQVADAHFRSMADPTDTEGRNLIRSAKNARQQLGLLQTAYQRAIEAQESDYARLTALRDKVLAPPTNPGQAAIDSELRQILRATPDDRRLEMVKNSAAMRAAVARSTAHEVTGLAPELHTKFQMEHWHAEQPDEAAQFEDLAASVRAGNTAMSEVEKTVKGLVDFELAEALEAGRYTEPAAV